MNSVSFPLPLRLSQLQIHGDLAVRSLLNYSRLEGPWYRPWEVFGADKHGWPGDWEGRIILALVSQAAATHREPAWLQQILHQLPQHLNERGYLGKICEPGWANEQQLAGHSWLVRGLIAQHERQPDPKLKAIISTIVKQLFLPVAENFRNYPITPEQVREPDHWELSHPQSKTKSHKGSIDTGCGFILMDGLTEAYRFLKWPKIKAMIEIMIERFFMLDLEGAHVQTHATLTCLRGICRYVELTGNRKLLGGVEKIFNRYKSVAMTEHYGNYNWWGRPRWTEPCAIIDSFILAVWLWRLSGRPEYIADAHLIYYNGLGHALRADGCFGTDFCLGAVAPEEDGGLAAYNPRVLQPRTYEVYWCCTMRGGEFFARAYEAAFMCKGREIWLPMYHDATVKLGGLTLRETSGYPYSGSVRLEVLKATSSGPWKLNFFVPPWKQKPPVALLNGKRFKAETDQGFLSLSTPLKAGDVVEVEFGCGIRVVKPHNQNTLGGLHAFYHGPMLLAADQPAPEPDQPAPAPAILGPLPSTAELEPVGRGKYRVKCQPNTLLSPVYDIEKMTRPWHSRQALFDGDLCGCGAKH
ncbi:MAG: hypothetical protein WCP06_09700 [Verrucomicrobiota bacterium]